MLYIAPSILAADYAALGQDVRKVANADLLHVDIMDGHFVPNLSFGPDLTRAVDGVTEQFLDMHLMIEQPERWFDTYVAAGGDRLIFHVEAVRDVSAAARSAHEAGAQAGFAVKPGTPIEPYLEHVELVEEVMIMSVEPGFGGQKFMPEVLAKAEALRAHIADAGLGTIIAIDGGIAASTIAQAAAAGVESFVAGSAVFGSDDPAAAVDKLRELARAAQAGPAAR
ncbi:ribulose-phosphate 3-epimerase [Corynebacterium liangguodongii]|uniref:Ribulose-phosphate 3-epimerase n=1 Tax=Corynebacterium liangguodongii TaxID=2079535 RepID=A0A2S0WE71_9CORY|nr:ribulose-phosphate 3-epimerase [Corynebacterium liangguodongii]AWB84066.1 ribulose-phosphate 3-epimerase [Corynebacterium liangguodongii]PWC00077.1 ribulose-phosphate 3-epimerase [Corynebacterium liangguodongii]